MECCRKLVLLGALALIVGALLPWTDWACPSIGTSVHVMGLDVEGAVSGPIGLLLLGMALTKTAKPGRPYSLVGTVLASCACAIAFDSVLGLVATISQTVSDAGTQVVATIGVGLVLTFAGAVLTLGGILMPIRFRTAA